MLLLQESIDITIHEALSIIIQKLKFSFYCRTSSTSCKTGKYDYLLGGISRIAIICLCKFINLSIINSIIYDAIHLL